ncbi:hypothetical protein RclHR1_02040022 [Rhizophagus clarus]|uniref:Uncharacterized protein n=1 Tax=Rhizophagus clarus TaxID=94130 RepID=A0A2Z6QRI3_9GLOM|nr:hypothetical protein RclHR1_02040022 [Rhizophagus clarus]
MDLDSKAYSKLIDAWNTHGGSEDYRRILERLSPLTKRHDHETSEMWCSRIRDPFRKILEDNYSRGILSKNGYITMHGNLIERSDRVHDTRAPQTILPYYIRRTLGGKWGWSTHYKIAEGYGAPAVQYSACRMFDVSIGDNNNWTKWVQAKITVWENEPGDQVEYALVGNNVTDQLAYIHEPRNPLKFLDIGDEPRLTAFSNTCS